MSNRFHFIGLCLFALAVSGCSDDSKENGEDSNSLNHRVNSFLEGHFKKEYLWADEIRNKSTDKQLAPESYFDDMRYTGDSWSRLTNEPQEGEIAATEDGYNYGFGFYSTIWKEGNSYLGIKINHVYPGSSAAKAGLERGDLIVQIDGESITDQNIGKISSTQSISVTVNKKMEPSNTQTHTLSYGRYTVEPLLANTIFTYEGKKIGYLYYTSFVYNEQKTSLSEMNDLFARFRSEQVDEFVLDLRSNGGGYSRTAVHMASLMAPNEAVNSEEVLIYKKWNATMESNVGAANKKETLDKSVPAASRLGLTRYWIITTPQTASSSEMLISGLRSYLGNAQVITVGEKTHGKYTGGVVYSPTASDIKSWNGYFITVTYTNRDGESVKGGISPTYPFPVTYEQHNSLFDDVSQLGSPTEPYLAAVLKHMTGVAPQTDSRAAGTMLPLVSRPLDIPARLIFEKITD